MARPTKSLLFGLASLIALGGEGIAAPVGPSDRNATATVDVRLPITMRKIDNLDFASLTVTAAGSATINPFTGAMTTAGGVVHATGTPVRARWRVSAVRTTLLRIRLPTAPITLTRVAGTEVMTASNFTQDGPALRLILLPGTLDFHVGARLNVAAGQAEGLYVGNFDIDVEHL